MSDAEGEGPAGRRADSLRGCRPGWSDFLLFCRSSPVGDVRRDLIAPLCQSGGGGCLVGVVGSGVAVDDLGELAFEAAQRLRGGLVLGLFALVVGAPWAGVHGL